MPYLKINQNNFFNNYQVLKNLTKDENKIAIVLKDNAYGHGILEIAKLAHQKSIKNAFVKNMQEALCIQHLFENISILYPQSCFLQNHFEQCLKTPNILFCVASLEFLKTLPNGTQIELKVNSGMNRNGISKEELKEAFNIITQKNLKLIGVFTHNGYGDDLGAEFFSQNQNFSQIKKEVLSFTKSLNLPLPRFHSLSSSGAFRDNTTQDKQDFLEDSFYRFGIAFYGYLCADSVFNFQHNLKPIASLWAQKISTCKLLKGQTIGYSGTSKALEDMQISTYDIGYGDGLFRIKEGMELFTKEGYRIFARASMDCISIQSTQEEVCIFEDVSEFAKAFNTIPYEILVHLHSYIPKKII
ncbi:alanine racemase [Helicobacter burdigaliensis]|uniref:alanine racemase n=1 Tax=Helicobacter burdigaliensis TaxID=2315334 RepID=UPI000EF678EE|nr:alanine racemase [Helicobacter burdigaliensis]